VADDDPLTADTLARILELHQFEARAVHSGEAAVELASTFRPDAAIFDVIFGEGLNGIETAIAVLQEFPACRILLFSGVPETATLLAHAANSGHTFRIFAKPTHPVELMEALGPHPPVMALD